MKLASTVLAAAAVAALGLSGVAHADPVTTNPGALTANGVVTAVFAFADAGNESELLRLNIAGAIFDNKKDAVGTTKSLGSNSGLIEFVLNNLTQGYSFVNDQADSGAGGDGYFHAKYGKTDADFGVTFSADANTAIAALGPNALLVGFEDKRGGDYDYNDLIFAFSSVQATPVPEPATLALLGTALAGMSLARRRRRG